MARQSVAPVPESSFVDKGGFVEDCEPDDLIYFLLNVGDGDTQLLLLPEDPTGTRAAVVVDIATTDKLPALLDELAATDTLLRPRQPLFEIAVATHPHQDHIGGMAQFLDRFGELVCELWEPGYYHPNGAYHEMLRALEDSAEREGGAIRHVQPTSGMRRFIGNVKITALSPAIGLRNRFDSYGVEVNNASISLKVEFPASRVEQRPTERRSVRLAKTQAIILGSDAQTMSWAQVMVDFPELRPDESPVAEALSLAGGSTPLRADVFKIPHHASKHGVNLELVEMIKPSICLVSSVGGGGSYRFPHLVAQEAVREGMEATTGTEKQRSDDHDLGIHYTSAVDSTGAPLGSMALVMSPTGRKRRLWRFGDEADKAVKLGEGRRCAWRDSSR
ncbi:hypothetical protein BH18ACT4_BH18ACT4_06330 [soil metagenome]